MCMCIRTQFGRPHCYKNSEIYCSPMYRADLNTQIVRQLACAWIVDLAMRNKWMHKYWWVRRLSWFLWILIIMVYSKDRRGRLQKKHIRSHMTRFKHIGSSFTLQFVLWQLLCRWLWPELTEHLQPPAWKHARLKVIRQRNCATVSWPWTPQESLTLLRKGRRRQICPSVPLGLKTTFKTSSFPLFFCHTKLLPTRAHVKLWFIFWKTFAKILHLTCAFLLQLHRR